MPSKSPEQSAAAFRAEPGEEPLRHRLHTPGEEVPRVAAMVPVQFSAPPFVERKSRLPQRHSVVPGTDDEATRRWRRRFDSQQIDG
jgi:hypothetical protein